MASGRSIGVSIGVALAIVLALGPGRAHAAVDPSCGDLAMPLQPGSLVYRLPHAFLRTGSDSVRVRGLRWTRGVDYELDALHGELRLLHDPLPGDTAIVSACWLLDPPPLERARMEFRGGERPRAAAVADTVPEVTPRAGVSRSRLDDAGGASLSLTGSKSVAVEFGSQQDAFLKQSLDLTLSGTLAPGVELTGVLSDQNTPLTATGSTQDLQALDRVLLELKTDRATAQLGDVDVSLAQGEFAHVDRRLQGMSAGWQAGTGSVRFAAASVPGQHRRMELYGTENFQGPYALTDDLGGTGISVVAGSEVVTLDGERLTRGETADYAIDYDAARITFTSRRPISASSRITVEYQFTSDRYRRRMIAGSSRWGGEHGYVFSSLVDESDDRGRPVSGTLSVTDREVLAFAGDSASRAVVPDVSGNGGDYDTVRVDSARVAFAYVGAGVGHFAVPFALVGGGHGDYEAYPVASGTAFRFVGSGQGAYRVGRALPLPESHQLANLGGGGRWGPLAAEFEGAVSRLDRNTLSTLDDQNNSGSAGRARIALETTHADGRAPHAGISTSLRAVDRRFSPFSPLTSAFAAEAWGLAPGADVEHRREASVEAFAGGRLLGELHGTLGRLTTPGGSAANRRELSYQHGGTLIANAEYDWAHGQDRSALHSDGGRERFQAALRWKLPWVEPGVKALSDTRRAPSDSIVNGARTRSAGVELASGARIPWQLSVGYERRREALAELQGLVDQGETRAITGLVRSPDQSAWGGELRYEHRILHPLADPQSTRGDYGALRLRGEDHARGLSGRLDLEVTGDGETRRARSVVYVGSGKGSYDALGNYVGTGDYTLVITVTPGFDRVSRAVTSAHVGWEFAPTPWLHGSRTQFDYETETRRRGDLGLWDPWIAPGAVLGDPGLALGSVRQRWESDVAPESRAAALHLRLERRVSADRQFDNFEQWTDARTASLTWRTRPSDVTTTELEGRLQREQALESLVGTSGLARTLLESGATAQLVLTPSSRLRAAAVVDAAWTRPEGTTETSRALKLGPDVGFAVGPRGHAELSIRRGFAAGAPAVALLPTRDPAGPARWDTSARLDYRVRESSTVGVSMSAVDRPGLRTVVTGRAEVRAFF